MVCVAAHELLYLVYLHLYVESKSSFQVFILIEHHVIIVFIVSLQSVEHTIVQQ